MKAPKEEDFVVLIVSVSAMGLMSTQSSSTKSVRVMTAASDCDYSQSREQMKSQHLSPASYSEMNDSIFHGCKFKGINHSENILAI